MNKLSRFGFTALAVVLSVGLAACGDVEQNSEEPSETVEHNFDSNGVCTDCGYVDMSKLTEEAAIDKYGYYVIDSDESQTYSVGDIVSFGSYPQAVVEDAAKLALLDAEKGTLPTADDAGDWTSYGYYDQGVVSDYAFYKDVTVSGVKYRGVYLLNYRPYYSGLAAGESYSYISECGYTLENVYWFEYSPISWTLLEYKDGVMFLNSKYSLDAQPFQDTYEISGTDYLIPGTENYVNNWEYSSIRTYLNGTFYNLAFDDAEKALIQTVTLDNKTTGYATDAPYQANQNNTTDNVFLLSYEDVLNTDFGYTAKGVSRNRSFTDYSNIQGLRPSTTSTTADGEPSSFYLLRSAADKSFGICGVSKLGAVSYATSPVTDESVDGLAINGDLGMLPAIYIKVF